MTRNVIRYKLVVISEIVYLVTLPRHHLAAKEDESMPGTSSAQTVDGTPTFQMVSFKFIDYAGDRYTLTMPFDPSTTAAEIEAVKDVLQASSNASLWGVDVTANYDGAMLRSNAVNEPRESADDLIVIHYKNAATRSDFRASVPAPVAEFLVDGTETPDPAATVLTNLLAALATAIPTGFAPTTVRFSEHREVNETVLIG